MLKNHKIPLTCMKKRGKLSSLFHSRLRVLFPVVWLYVFILAIDLLKKTSLLLSPHLTNLIQVSINTNPLKAVSLGWFFTSIFQSSSVMDSVSLTFLSNSLIPANTALLIIMGGMIGTSITTLIIALLVKADKRRDFRHGFEISAALMIYNLLLVIIFFSVEVITGFFSSLINHLNPIVHLPKLAFVPNFLSLITSPVTDLLSRNLFGPFSIIIAILLLLLSIRSISRSMIHAFGGEEKTKKFIHRYFNSKTRAFFLGLVLTAIVFSSTITLGVIVPLVVSRLINLKKVIPFIIGSQIGAITSLVIASLVIGTSIALSSVIVFFCMLIAGALIFLPDTDLIFNITKYLSKHILHISRKRAIVYLVGFVLLPFLLLLII